MKDEADSADNWKHSDPTERTPNQKLNADQAEHAKHAAETVTAMKKVWAEIQRLMRS